MDTNLNVFTGSEMNPDLWKYERTILINHIRALLKHPNDPDHRRRALDMLVEVFEDDDMENVKP
jgi:hypothetical protein